MAIAMGMGKKPNFSVQSISLSSMPKFPAYPEQIQHKTMTQMQKKKNEPIKQTNTESSSSL